MFFNQIDLLSPKTPSITGFIMEEFHLKEAKDIQAFDSGILEQNSSQTRNKVHFDKINLMYEQVIIGVIAQYIAVIFVVIALKQVTNFYTLLFWACSSTFVLTLWVFVILLYHYKPRQFSTTIWCKIYALLTFLTGSCWGLMGFLLTPENHYFLQMFIAVLLFGLTAGSLPFSSPIFHIYVVYAVPALIPFIIWLFMQSTNIHYLLASSVAVYLVAMLGTSFYINKFLTKSLKLKHQNMLLASHDILTGLPNKSLLYDRMNQGINYSKRFESNLIVFFLDIDNFKLINDNLGHDAGDFLLKEVAKRLQNCVRESDTVSRYGGDEFVILFLANNLSQMYNLSQKLLKQINKPFIIAGQELIVTASIGASIYPKDGIDATTLLKNADIAMYLAKNQGKNNFKQFFKEIYMDSKQRFQIQTELYNGLNKKEFIIYYQPIIDLKSDQITAAEALIRWQHPMRGLLEPSDFIPIAEESGFIVQLGQWIIHQACKQTKLWQQAGLPEICMAINISAPQIHDDNFEEFIDKTLKNLKLDYRYIELELTETSLMKSSELIKHKLSQLKQKGIHIAIDDFGIGYSSFNYLKLFPIEKLKIDSSFIKNIATNENDASIVQAFIALGRGLQLKLIAEGIENKKQLDFLKKNNCEEGQGYYFSPPLPPEKFAQLLDQNTEKPRKQKLEK